MRRYLALILLAACATTPPAPLGGPRGMRASDHLTAARTHDEQAAEQDWPDATGTMPYRPWFRTWENKEHDKLAEAHRFDAVRLASAYEEACAGLSPGEAMSSPLQRFGLGGWPTSTGYIVYLSPDAGTPERLLATIACHRAYMMMQDAGMDDCPLDLPGVIVDARGDADLITLSVVVSDARTVPELHRRAALELAATTSIHRVAPQ